MLCNNESIRQNVFKQFKGLDTERFVNIYALAVECLINLNIFVRKVYLSSHRTVCILKTEHLIYILLGPPGCAQVFPLLEPGPPRFFWWYENSE